MKNIYKENDEVIYTKESIINFSAQDLSELKQMAMLNPRKRIRICFHSSKNDKIHEMIIYHPKGAYVAPHKHLGKEESFHLISGEVECVIFNNQGNITKAFPMGDYASGKAFYYKIPVDTFHTQIFKQDTFFHEVTSGPFRAEETILAPWSPKETDIDAVSQFMAMLASFIKNHE